MYWNIAKIVGSFIIIIFIIITATWFLIAQDTKSNIAIWAKNQKKIVRCYECVQQPGEIIFVPSMWHHAVLNVADSVAVTQNFVDMDKPCQFASIGLIQAPGSLSEYFPTPGLRLERDLSRFQRPKPPEGPGHTCPNLPAT